MFLLITYDWTILQWVGITFAIICIYFLSTFWLIKRIYDDYNVASILFSVHFKQMFIPTANLGIDTPKTCFNHQIIEYDQTP